MSLPFTTTTVKIERPVSTLQDSLVEPTWTTVASGVPCVLGGLSGSESMASGAQIVRNGGARFNPGVDVRSYDRLTDERTGDAFECGNVQQRIGFGLDHINVELRKVVGAHG